MNYTIDNHPSEDVLIENALHEVNEEVRTHIEECEKCHEFVDDVRTIEKDISEIKEEEIPAQLQARILDITKKKQARLIVAFLQNWHKNPFLFGLITAIVAVMLFVIFEFYI